MKKIYGFYHIALMRGGLIHDWDILFKRHLDLMESTGLLEKTNNEYEILLNIAKNYSKLELVYHNTDIKNYEFLTLQLIQNLAEKENFYCYYLHSKGVSITNIVAETIYPNTSKGDLIYNINSWLSFLDYFLIEKSIFPFSI